MSYLRCPSAEIVNILWFNFLEEDLTWAPIGANVKSAGFIPLGLKAAFPQCFALETTNSLIPMIGVCHFECFLQEIGGHEAINFFINCFEMLFFCMQDTSMTYSFSCYLTKTIGKKSNQINL